MISSVLKEAKIRFKEAGIKTYALDSELLLAHVLDISRDEVIFKPEREMSDDELLRFQKLVERRLEFEPVSQIVGQKEFWEMEFKVNKHTLTPRPDSETLIEAVLGLISDRNRRLKILDLGTGTGCLILSLLKEYKHASGVAVDQSEEALKVAKENAQNLGFDKRVSFCKSNWFQGVENEKFNVVMSNPPYIRTGDLLPKDVADYEPDSALFAGVDGLDDYRGIAKNMGDYLAQDGIALFEIGEGQKNDVQEIFEDRGFKMLKAVRDLAGIERCVVFTKA